MRRTKPAAIALPDKRATVTRPRRPARQNQSHIRSSAKERYGLDPQTGRPNGGWRFLTNHAQTGITPRQSEVNRAVAADKTASKTGHERDHDLTPLYAESLNPMRDEYFAQTALLQCKYSTFPRTTPNTLIRTHAYAR